MGHEENCQSLFSLSSSRERSERLRCALSPFSQRSAVLRSKMLKRVQHDRFRRFRNDVCYYSRHDFLEVPLIVIPNLFRDLSVDLIQGRVHDLGRVTKDGSSQRSAGLGF